MIIDKLVYFSYNFVVTWIATAICWMYTHDGINLYYCRRVEPQFYISFCAYERGIEIT